MSSDLSPNLPEGKLNIRVAALIIDDGKLLLESGYDNSFFVLPGGRIKFGETAEQAVVREIREELGVEIQPIRCLYIHQNFFPWNKNLQCHELAFYFLAQAPQHFSEQLQLRNKDGKSSFSWLELNKLQDVEFYPLCIKQNIFNLPQHTEIAEEHYDVVNGVFKRKVAYGVIGTSGEKK